jgi:hypothetical protein
MNKQIAFCIAAAAFLAGCASADLADNNPPQPEKQYRTGSNIPRRPDQMPDSVQTAKSPGDGSMGVGGSMPVPGPGGH